MWKIVFDNRLQEFTVVDFMDTIGSTDGVSRFPSAFERGDARLSLFGDSKEELLEGAEALADMIRQEIYTELDEDDR